MILTPSLAHILLYGLSGGGKSTLASQAPKPQHIDLFDSLGNATPYFTNCRVSRDTDYVIVDGKLSEISIFNCYAIEDTEKTSLLRRIYHYASSDPNNPLGVKQFRNKLPSLVEDCKKENFASYIFDSLTLFHAQARHAVEQWRDIKPDDIAREVTNVYEDLCQVLSSLDILTIVISHLSTQGETRSIGGKSVRTRKDVFTTAPGRMASNIFSYFSDIWYCFVNEEQQYRVLTSNDGELIAKNTFKAPHVCESDFEKITQNQAPIIWE